MKVTPANRGALRAGVCEGHSSNNLLWLQGQVRNKPSDAPSPPPHCDVFIRHRERRLYNRPGETKIRISSTPEMIYYHPVKSCTNLTASDVREGKLIVADDVQKNLSSLHKRVLFKEFGMMLNQ